MILGGGFGGAAAAITARRLLTDDHEVVLIDRSTESWLCGVNPAVIVGAADPLSRRIGSLERQGVMCLTAEVERVDLERSTVSASGVEHPFDSLVLALGVTYNPLPDGAHSFYDHDSAMRLRDRLAKFDGGSIVLGVAGTPYRCPPAPLEAVLMIDGEMRRRGRRAATRLTVVVPEPAPLGVAGPAASARVRQMLSERDITLVVGRTVTSVDPAGVTLDDGSLLEADVPVVVPVHRAPAVVTEAGLTGPGGWVQVDRASLETRHPGVYAAGDVNSIPIGERGGIPKAGVFAAGQGRHVAAVIAHRLGVVPSPGPYDGVGHCFLMLGAETGARVGGAFLADGGPDVALDEPSAEGRRAKDAWEQEWARFEV